MLHSIRECYDYVLEATDGNLGHCTDLLFDHRRWMIRYMVIDTGEWLPGRKVLVPTEATIKNSPTYDPLIPVNRKYELMLYDYYGRPKYWE